ncbi:phosphodiesterase [Pleionea sediminis]|uniref:phosphodiesterase n=1 Tax=Pleionea sediminis TaxID=2569479 RepID=UPI0011859A8A|nr:phosphodiesterase [Pleionea sediminis]
MKTWLLAGIFLTSISTFAATGNLAIGEQSQNSYDKPRSGQSMNTVRENFGTPIREIPAVGEPPITRWVYNGFTVYFEHDRVIHAVAHRS